MFKESHIGIFSEDNRSVKEMLRHRLALSLNLDIQMWYINRKSILACYFRYMCLGLYIHLIKKRLVVVTNVENHDA